tara:strand:+ start:861 stop:1433 length:573 start_codon:yes stop_codon:yes gene_type:complete
MSLEKGIAKRSGSVCELCSSEDNLSVYAVPPVKERVQDRCIHVCGICNGQLAESSKVDANHWRCLNESMWSEVDAVKVVAYRMLHQIKSAGWSQDLIDMMYLDDETLVWAKEGVVDEDAPVHKDAKGNVLVAGDSVVLTQSLNVKGSSLTAKKGTVVKRISLVHDNAEQIEGRVEGQQIVILTKFVRKNS